MPVVIPDSLAGDVLRRLLRDLEREVRAHGGELPARARRLLYELHEADQRHQEAVSFSEETPAPVVGSVGVMEIGTAAAAVRMGCSRQYVGQLVRSGLVRGRKVGPTLLVDLASLDDYRFGRTHVEHDRAG